MHPEIYEQIKAAQPTGLILHGPSGCGKTLFARAVAGVSVSYYFKKSLRMSDVPCIARMIKQRAMFCYVIVSNTYATLESFVLTESSFSVLLHLR